jgi:hypothetical protein
VPFGAQPAVIMNDSVEDGTQHAPMRAPIALQPIENELGDGCVADQVRPAQYLEMA